MAGTFIYHEFRRSLLHQAALGGNWGMVEYLLTKQELWGTFTVMDSITRDEENLLHISAGSKHSGIVEKLMEKMSSDEVALKNKHNNTALCFAAISGPVRNAELIVKKNSELPLIHGFENKTPLFMAISCKRREMASYLLQVTDIDKFNIQEQFELLIASIHSNFYGN